MGGRFVNCSVASCTPVARRRKSNRRDLNGKSWAYWKEEGTLVSGGKSVSKRIIRSANENRLVQLEIDLPGGGVRLRYTRVITHRGEEANVERKKRRPKENGPRTTIQSALLWGQQLPELNQTWGVPISGETIPGPEKPARKKRGE